MGSAISIGTTGLTASSKQMDVIGNNLANSNTLGYKAGNTYFASMLNQSLSSSGALSVGQGVAVSDVATQYTQGSFETTGNATDLAIDGDGFFLVKDKESAIYYTRAGNFHINKEGYLVDGNDYKVQGYNTFSSTSTIGTDVVDEQADISLKNVQSAPKSSTKVSVGVNLDENADYGEKFNVSQSVFDSKGALHNLSITFLKTDGAGMWGFDAKLDDANLADTGDLAGCGVIFDANGVLSGMYKGDIDNTVATTAGTGTIDDTKTVVARPGQIYKDATGITLTKGVGANTWAVTDGKGYDNMIAWQETTGGVDYLKVDLDGKGGSDIVFQLDNAWATGDTVVFDVAKTDVGAQDLTLTFGDLGNGSTIGISDTSAGIVKNRITWGVVSDDTNKITGFASTSVIKALTDNGYSSGILKGMNIGVDGTILGSFTNGQTSKLGQIIMADFPNPGGLKKIGNYFGQTTDSGEAIKNRPGSGGLGEIMSNELEMSNTDVAKEFINMITAQRAYQANSQVITTSDQMLTVLMNIKR